MPSGDPQAGVLLEHTFDAFTLHALREAVLAHATAAGMPEDRAVEVVLAVHELAANAVRHGAGSGRLRILITRGALRCQVSDTGPASPNGQPTLRTAADTADPWPYQPGHGLWLVRNAADQVSVVTGRGGTAATVVFTVPTSSPRSAGR